MQGHPQKKGETGSQPERCSGRNSNSARIERRCSICGLRVIEADYRFFGTMCGECRCEGFAEILRMMREWPSD
jgi:hypothetical protein